MIRTHIYIAHPHPSDEETKKNKSTLSVSSPAAPGVYSRSIEMGVPKKKRKNPNVGV